MVMDWEFFVIRLFISSLVIWGFLECLGVFGYQVVFIRAASDSIFNLQFTLGSQRTYLN